jgi:threonyl-tRNA synthetase
MMEFGGLHRYESSGSLLGLLRVRRMVQDDAHIFCTEAQIESESKIFVELLQLIYRELDVELHSVKLALRPEQRFGTDEQWTIAEDTLERAANAAGVEVERVPNEGAFYGPKLEFHLRDAIGRTWQCGTLQLDYVLPERLDATYIAEDGQKHRPVMLHRAILGSLERFIGVLIEHYAGAFPLWLAPVQIGLVPISNEKHLAYAESVKQRLEAAGLRVELDASNGKMQGKIRDFGLQKIPFILIMGDKEAATESVAVRVRAKGDEGSVPLADFITRATKLVATHSMEL